MDKRLHRSSTNKMVAGVCGGLAEYFGLDVSLVRIIWAIALLVFGAGFLFYIILWIVLPVE
jgi:phage shock protein PspC (stress-responsive transcriptional regulator)